LPIAVVCVSLSLLLYTAAVWIPFARRCLSGWALAGLWSGFVLDSLGTGLMAVLAGGWKPTFHGFTGLAANALMLLVAVTATILSGRKAADPRHWYWPASAGVWVLWLLPMVGGAVFGGRV